MYLQKTGSEIHNHSAVKKICHEWRMLTHERTRHSSVRECDDLVWGFYGLVNCLLFYMSSHSTPAIEQSRAHIDLFIDHRFAIVDHDPLFTLQQLQDLRNIIIQNFSHLQLNLDHHLHHLNFFHDLTVSLFCKQVHTRGEEKLAEETKMFGNTQEKQKLFLLNLAHDMRNPLNAAKMSADLIRKGLKTNELVLKCAKVISESVSRTDRMLQELLDSHCSGNAGHRELKREYVDLNFLLSHLCQNLSVIYSDRFRFVSSIPVYAEVDQDRILRAVENLLTNAIKYGSKVDQIGVALSQTQGFTRIEIQNRGEPIPASERNKIFSGFHRSASARAGQESGWGIGLAFVKKVAEAHGGEVSVRCNDTEGTVFQILLPRYIQ